MTLTPSFLIRGFIHFYGIILMTIPLNNTSFYGIKNGIDMFGLLKLGDNEAERTNKLVINFSFSSNIIFGLFGSFYCIYFNFLL